MVSLSCLSEVAMVRERSVIPLDSASNTSGREGAQSQASQSARPALLFRSSILQWAQLFRPARPRTSELLEWRKGEAGARLNLTWDIAVRRRAGHWIGDRYIRRLLVLGIASRIKQIQQRPDQFDPWFAIVFERLAAPLAIVVMANKSALIIWAVRTRKQEYKIRVA